MTAPDAPDGNDDVIRVVYQAVADYSQLIRENRRARDETRALKRDIDQLAGTTTHTVRVTADTAQARTELARVLRDVVVQIRVAVDAARARTELAQALRDVTVRARVVVDALAANTELARVLRDVVIRARIVVDAATARAEIARTVRDTEVKVKVTTDQTGLAALAAALARIRDLTVNVAVRADHDTLTRLRRQLAALRDVTVNVTLDDAAAIARLQTLLAAGEGLHLRVDLDEHGLLTRFRALIAQLQAEAHIVVHYDDTARPLPLPTPDRPTGGGRPAADARSAMPDWLTGAASMVLKFVPAIAALVPIAAAAAAGIGGIAAAFVAAGAGAGIFAVAAVGAVARLTKAVQDYEKTGQLPSGPIRGAVDQFEALKRRYTELQQATDHDVFAVFNKGLRIAYDLLDKIQDVIAPVARAIGGALDQVDTAINGAGFGQFLSFVADQAPNAIAKLTTGLLGFGGGIGRLLMQFTPFARAFLDGFARMGAEFDHWAAGLSGNTGFQQFIGYATAAIPRVIDLIVNLIRAGANLVTALAPIGTFFLAAANSAAKFIAAIPTDLLTVIIAGIIGLSVAVKGLQAAIAVTAALKKFGEFLMGLPGWAGRAATAVGAVRASLIALGAATLITAAITGIILLLQNLTQAQDDAAAAATTHADSVRNLGQLLAESGGKITPAIKAARLQTLTDTTVDASESGTKGNSNVVDMAQRAGVDLKTINEGSLGDQHAYSQTYGALSKYANEQRAAAKSGVDASGKKLDKQGQYEALVNADLAEKAADKYAALSEGSLKQATTYAQQYEAAVGGVNGALSDNVKVTNSAADVAEKAGKEFHSQADAHNALKTALSADFGAGETVGKYNAATTALQAYDDALAAHADAVQAVSDATLANTRAEQAVIKAREDAVQRMKDLQRTLRDSAIDERQAALNVRTSDKSLQKLINSGASADEIEQARLENERTHNALNDLRQDKAPKKTATQRELAKGVDHQDALIDAQRNVDATARQLATANKNVVKAYDHMMQLHLVFQTTAGALGLSEDQVRKLKTRIDSIRNKTVNVTVKLHGDDALRKILQGQYAMQLIAEHPDWKPDRIMAAAASYLPTVTPTPTSGPGTKLDSGNMNPNVNPGRAEGGPLYASPVTSGPVPGPGTGTSDSVQVVLPVGGPARLSRGEHIVTDSEVQRAPGGHSYLEAFRAGLRAGRPWAPARPGSGYAGGGRILLGGWPAAMPALRAPLVQFAVPGYAGGGPAQAAARGIADVVHNRSVTVNVGTITNAVPESAGASLYRQVRRAVDGEDR